jgi:hypothetical protein
MLDDDRKRWRFLNGPVKRMARGDGNTILVAREGALQRIAPNGLVVERSRSAGVRKVFHLRNNTIWASGDVIYQVQSNRRELELLEPTGSLRDVVQIEAGPDGGIWACGDNGVLRRDRRVWRSVLPKIANPGCSSLAIDKDGRVWYAPQLGGRIYVVEQASSEKPIARALPRGSGEGGSHFLAVDRRGWLWRGCALCSGSATGSRRSLDEARADRWPANA